MATTKGQKSVEIAKRKVASKLALAEAQRDTDYQALVKEYMAMGYGENEAKTAASALRNKYYAELRRSIVAEAGLEDDFDGAEAIEDADVDDTELEDDDNVDLEGDVDVDEADGMLDDAEEVDEGEFGGEGDDMLDEEGIDLDSDEPVVEDDIDMPGDGDVVEEIEVPGGKLKIVFEPSDLGSEEDLEDVEEVSSMATPLEEDFGQKVDLGRGVPTEGAGMPMREESLLASNRAARKRILAEVLGENVEAKDKGLGEDTAHSGGGTGKPSTNSYKMKDSGEHGVAGPGEEGKSMTLQNSEGNSLKSDPKYLYFDVPTAMSGTKLQQENARGRMKLEGEYGELAKQSVEFADAPVPTEGGADYAEFELPTQLNTTKQRKVTVASSEDESGLDLTLDEVKSDGQLRAAFEFLKGKRYASSLYSANTDEKVLRTKVANKECDAYDNNKQAVNVVECEDCGGRFVLSQRAIQNEYCPGCQATIVKAVSLVKESCVDKAMWKEEYGEDLCEADENSVTRDPNGDGGFKTQGKKGGAPKEKNARDMELDADQYEKVAENEALKNVLAETKYEQARSAEAYRTAARLVQAGIIEPLELEEQVGQMLGEGMTAEAMKIYGEQATKLAQKTRKAVVAENSANMKKQAGLTRNFSIVADEPVELTQTLANCFSSPKTLAFGENGRLSR